jgi:hypothetical protein
MRRTPHRRPSLRRSLWPLALAGALAWCAGCGDDNAGPGDAGTDGPEPRFCGADIPSRVPFTLTRPDVGEPVTETEVAEFTRKLTGFWKDVGYFQWIVDTSHGVEASTGMRDWWVWWTGVDVVKAGGEVTFYHSPNGGPDNIFIPTSRVLAQLSAGYMLTGDPTMGRVVEQYSKGLSASMLGMVFGADDPINFIMARAIIANNHDQTLGDGRVKHIDYEPWRHETTAWNSNTIHVPDNPYWGDIWAKNMRSKDDVPHIYHATALLPYVVACGADPAVRDAAAEALELMQLFTKDIVDTGYHIRSKDETGAPFIPDERYPDLDLSTFVKYEPLIPNAECNAKLCTALIAYDDPKGNDCLDGFGGAYEEVATKSHYYNVAIIRGFHVAAILHALSHWKSDHAKALLEGLVVRIDRDLDLPDTSIPTNREEWEADLAVYLAQALAAGLPLTSREVRLIHREYGAAVDAFAGYDRWDVWDPSVADGTFGYRPGFRVDIQDMGMFLEACWSPFRNASGALPVDCDVVADPSRWGT